MVDLKRQQNRFVICMLLCAVTAFFLPFQAYAQKHALSVLVGIEKAYPDQKITTHPRYEFAAQFAISRKSQIYIGSAYTRNHSKWSRYELKYMANIYVGRDAQLFENYALDIGTTWMVRSHLSLTFGISANWIKLKRAVFNPDFPFILHYYGDRVDPYFDEKLDSKQWAPGVFVMIGFQKPIWSPMELGLQLNYKLVWNVKDFIDKEHPNLMMLAILPCLRFCF